MGKTTWTEEATERAKKMWTDGKTATEIAMAIRGATRNSVLSKMHREKMPLKVRTATGIRKPRVHKPRPPTVRRWGDPVQMAAPRPKAVVPVVIPDEPVSLRLTLAELATGDFCRWIAADPAKESPTYCGHPTVDGRWCSHHRSRVFAPRPVAKERHP